MNGTLANAHAPWPSEARTSLDTRDSVQLYGEERYCPTRLLSDFALLMAAHGWPVCTSMMLGDREYAMWQLARAHTVCDAHLRETAARLFAYFDEHGAPVPVRTRA
jgi:hypothetical protein